MSQSTRYERQARLAQIGKKGQEAIQQSRVVIVGVGALGSVAADLLARAGVGELVLLDRDVVEWPNLQRQVLYDEQDAVACRPKVEAAEERLRAINSDISIQAHAIDLSYKNASSYLRSADLFLDGTDNFDTRYLLNDYAVQLGKPYIYAGVVGTYGLVGAILPQQACLRCTYPEPPEAADTPNCRTTGVLGPAVSVISGLACGEALKCLSGHADAVHPGFRFVDLWNGESRSLQTSRDPHCACCKRQEFPWLSGKRGRREAHPLCGGNAVQIPAPEQAPNLQELGTRLQGTVNDLQVRAQFLRFQSGDLDLILFADGRAIVRGTEDAGRAQAFLARTVGA